MNPNELLRIVDSLHREKNIEPEVVFQAIEAALVSAALALLAFAWSWAKVPATLDGKAYYEVLFWGGGHVLQFTWTLLMLVAWLWLAEAAGAKLPVSKPFGITWSVAARR